MKLRHISAARAVIAASAAIAVAAAATALAATVANRPSAPNHPVAAVRSVSLHPSPPQTSQSQPAPPPQTSPSQPALSPAQGPPGTVVTASATGWPGCSSMSVSGWDRKLGTAGIDGTGAFSLSFMVPSDATLGATQLQFSPTCRLSTHIPFVTFTVTQGRSRDIGTRCTVEPDRHRRGPARHQAGLAGQLRQRDGVRDQQRRRQQERRPGHHELYLGRAGAGHVHVLQDPGLQQRRRFGLGTQRLPLVPVHDNAPITERCVINCECFVNNRMAEDSCPS